MRTPIDLPSWARCVNCYVPATGGRIIHRRGCPEHRRPRRVELERGGRVRAGDLPALMRRWSAWILGGADHSRRRYAGDDRRVRRGCSDLGMVRV